MRYKKLLTALSVGLITCNLASCTGSTANQTTASEKKAGTEGFVVSISKNDANGKGTLVYSGTYKNFDISEKSFSVSADASQTTSSAVTDPGKLTITLLSDEKYYDDSFKANQASVPTQNVTINEVKSLLKDKWDAYINGVEDQGVNADEFVQFMNDNGINIETFIALSSESGLSFSDYMAVVKKINALSSGSLEGFGDLLIGINKNMKDFMQLLDTSKIKFDDILAYLKDNKYTFSDIIDFLNFIGKDLPSGLTELGNYITNKAKLPISSFSVKGDTPDPTKGIESAAKVGDTMIKGIDLAWKIISGTTIDSSNDSKHAILATKDPTWENYTGSFRDKSDSYTFKVTDAWFKDLVITQYTFWLEGECNASNPTIKGHWVPDMRFRVGDDKTVAILMTSGIDVSPSYITNKGTVDEVKPSMQLYANVYAKMLGLPWKGVTAAFKTIVFNVEGGQNGKCFSMQY